MQAGEILRRTVFNALDMARGGKLNTLKKVNKREIVDGVTDAYVKRRLQAILNYAKKHSAYFGAYQDAEKLEDFPVMDKITYLENKAQVLSDEYKGREESLYRLTTSGSTGNPFSIVCDRDKMDRINMNFISVMELSGYRLGMKRAEFRVWIRGKNTISRFKSIKNNLIMIDVSNLSDESLAGICDTIKKKHIQCLVSYSSVLTVLTGYIKRVGVNVKEWDVEMIYAMGEGLPQAAFDAVKEIFGFAPIRSYGNNEQGHIAVELNEENKYTIDQYNYYVELLKLECDEPALPGELGRIVVTDLYNRAFPMIRYDTGDTGILEEYHDEAGRKHAKFTEIYGRRGSMLYNCAGEPLSIHVFMNVLLDLEGIVHQAKCIQWEKKRYELLLNADREKINEKEVVGLYRRYLGDEAQIDVTYVDEIPVQASGKRMACENRCPDYQ